MREKNWQQVQEVFNHAASLRGRDRYEYLKKTETEAREIYHEVVSLLSAEELIGILPNSQADFDFLTGEKFLSAETEVMGTNAINQEISIIGEKIGARYEIVKKLGSGGMGDVYLARDQNLMNRETVVKLLKSETLANRELVRKFKQEIEALARLKDAGIVTILDSGTYGNQPFLVLEYVEGEDLALIISPILFSTRDFTDVSQLSAKLAERRTPAARYFLEKLSPSARAAFSDRERTSQLATILRDEFNRLLAEPRLYDRDIFEDSKFATLAEDAADTEDFDKILKINRLLIESAFPGEVIRGKEKKLKSVEAALIFRQLGVSLTHGHKKGIIHRDLKPANIMVTENERGAWQTKLIDFGVAKVRESLVAPSTEFGVLFGTRKYMSPEQINGKDSLTPTTDVYALGLIAFESLTGQHVFRTDSFIEQCRMQENEEFSDLTGIRADLSPKVKEIICRALSYKPENRQSSAEEFGNSLADALLTPPNELVRTEPHIPVSVKPNEAETDILDNRKISPIENFPGSKTGNGNKKTPSTVAGILLILILLGAGGWLVWRNVAKSPAVADTNVNSVPIDKTIKRELNYKLIVQKYYQGKSFQPPFAATGDEIFGDDWRFRIITDSPQNGNLYLLSENQNTRNLTMLFPHPQRNNGKSEVAANEKIETGEMRFDKNQGTEKFWIIWSENPVAELEAVKSNVNPQDLGHIKDTEKEKAVWNFLDKATTGEKLIEKIADDKQSKNIKTSDQVLIKMTEFRHN